MTQLVNKLPHEWKRTWVKESLEIEKGTGEVAGFSYFVEFVTRLSDEANSLYGRRVLGPHSSYSKFQSINSDRRKPAKSYNVVVTKPFNGKPSTNLNSFACFYCKESSHGLLTCPKFKNAPLQERSLFIKQNKYCYKCLSSKHRTQSCTKQNTCSIKGCTGTFHHTLLHPVLRSSTFTNSKDASTSTSTPSGVTETDSILTCSIVSSTKTDSDMLSSNSTVSSLKTRQMTDDEDFNNAVYLCVVPVKVTVENKEVLTYAFLDQGSTHSFCNKKLIASLGISGTPDEIVLQTLTDSKAHKGCTFSLSVSSLDGKESFVLPKVFSIDDIPVTPNAIPAKNDLSKLSHLRGLHFPRIHGATVTLLIGADAPEIFCMQSIRKGTRGQPIAVETPLGWSLLGPSLSFSTSKNCSVNFVKSDPVLKSQISSLWETDFGNDTSVFGIPTSREDRVAYDIMSKSVNYIAGHYHLPLLWRSDVELPEESIAMAQRRLFSLKKRLSSDTVLCNKYVNVLENYIDKGYAKKVSPDQLDNTNVKWYLPHHPVFHPKKPDKVRIVFDCAAKHKGASLNDALYQGPVLTNSLVGVLTRFRKNNIALVADIEQLFHQVKVKSDDCDALRFLWWPNGNLAKTPEIYQMVVHLFGATSSPCCAVFSLRQTVFDFGKEFDPRIANTVLNNFYVDDCLCSVSSVAEGIEVAKKLPELLSKGGFRLTKWLSNNNEVLQSIPATELCSSLQFHELDVDVKERVLGVYWNVQDDEFGFNVVLPERPSTRRGILSVVSSLYDPLGFVAPLILQPKLMLQRLCKQGLGWDSTIAQDDLQKWENWLSSLPKLSDFRIRRCLKPASFENYSVCEIHHFADASSFAYGACCYLRLINNQGKIHCPFLIGKSRLAPIKSVSIPRLELTAAVLSVKLDKLVRQELDLNNCKSIFWTDSTAVLFSIRNTKRKFPVFVANRLSVIEQHCSVLQWRHVPSKLNPADLASRGAPVDKITSPNMWSLGPKFLWLPEVDWPSSPGGPVELPSEFLLQRRRAIVNTVTNQDLSTDRLIKRYSALPKLLKTTSWLLRYKKFLIGKVKNVNCSSTKYLSADELKCAEIELIKYIQLQHFSALFKICSSSNRTSAQAKFKCSRSMHKLQPMLVDGILRVGGRLERARINYGNKHPIILPNNSHLTNLFIQKHHLEVGHSGAGHTWTSLRQEYWIIKGSSAVRRVINNCILCKKRNASACKQLMADLPQGRLQYDTPCFSHVGIDYFGPLLVKQGRSQVKRYGCLFTCLTMRAIHIEIAHGLDNNSFLNALRRFISRRSNPTHLYSDNGTNFVGAERVLRDSIQDLDQRKVNEFLSLRNINWHFNPPNASHMGGA